MPLELAVRGAEASKADVSRCRRVLCRVATTDSAPTTSAPSERKDKREYVVYFGGNAYSGAEVRLSLAAIDTHCVWPISRRVSRTRDIVPGSIDE
jgi:hypothetical protein